MEQIGALIKKQQAGTSLQKSYTTLSLNSENGESSISVFAGDLKPETVSRCVAKVKAAFPSLPGGFFSILIERLKDKGFSDERLIESVNNVIDTCQYPTPTLANFLSFDKRVKIYTYSEMCNAVTSQSLSGNSFDKITISKKLFWVKKSDKVQYNLPDEF